MLLLVTGASGAGKSTVRRRVQARFADVLEAAELAELNRTPQWSLAWRHQAVEKAVRRALQVQREGKHFLLCGDPIPPGEVLAAPSAPALEGMAVCLLHVSPDAQARRLRARGDDPALLPAHAAFAEWMRAHVADPTHRPDVVMTNGWEEMRWERWTSLTHAPWDATAIDTSDLRPEKVADRVAAWIARRSAPPPARMNDRSDTGFRRPTAPPYGKRGGEPEVSASESCG